MVVSEKGESSRLFKYVCYIGYKMEKSIVELRSINKLEDVLTRTERIEPNIARGDKIPSWDGEIIVYKSKEINKSNIMGNIRVQVKGHQKDNIEKDKIKHPVYKSDLANYKVDGGCIFFVVLMKNMDEFAIYYYSLLPYDLKLILDDFPDDKDSISLEFLKYPQNDIEMQMKLFRSFVHNRNKQVGTVQASFSLSKIDEEKAKSVENFSFTLFQTGENLEDMFKSAFKMPTYVYADMMNGKISVPVQKMRVEQITTSEFSIPVCLNGKCYYDKIRIRMLEDDEQLLIGKSFVCSTKNGKMSFSLRGRLSERIRDLNFLLNIVNGNKTILTVGDSFRAEFGEDELSANFEETQNNLLYMGMVKSALETLGVNEDLECDDFSQQDEWLLQVVIKSVIMGNLLISEEELPLVVNLRVANITLPIVIRKVTSNAYKLTSLFDTENVRISADNGEMISVHLVMKKTDFLQISNIDYNMIIREIMQQEYTETVDSLVTMFMLNGIMAFDERKNTDLYDMLVKVSDWQIEKCGNDINYLNNYQLLKRTRKLTIEEISKLNTIKMENQDKHIKLGVAILLESNTEIDAYWRQLDDEQKNLFRKYPICHLAEDLLQE